MSGNDDSHGNSRDGLFYGVSVYLIWGLLPLYFKLLATVGAVEIVAHRILWSLLLVGALLAFRGQLRTWASLLRTPSVLRLMLASATLIAINWLTYIWAVNHDHVVAASLGYFLNPLVNVLIGLVVFGERLNRMQGLAIAFAATGVAILAFSAPGSLWISLTLAFSFGFYGMVRKLAPVGSLEGLTIETLLLSPLALAYLLWLWHGGTLDFGHDHGIDALLVSSAVATSVPLLLFASAARRLRYSTLGVLQYLAPTMQFILGVAVFGEPLTPRMLLCFALIWTGLAIFTGNALAARRRRIAPGTATR